MKDLSTHYLFRMDNRLYFVFTSEQAKEILEELHIEYSEVTGHSILSIVQAQHMLTSTLEGKLNDMIQEGLWEEKLYDGDFPALGP